MNWISDNLRTAESFLALQPKATALLWHKHVIVDSIPKLTKQGTTDCRLHWRIKLA
jgi:hypothetical protein